MKVFKSKEFDSYSTKLYNNYKGVEASMYMQVDFPKGKHPINDTAEITPLKFFMSCYKCKDGSVKPKMVLQEWLEATEESTNEDN